MRNTEKGEYNKRESNVKNDKFIVMMSQWCQYDVIMPQWCIHHWKKRNLQQIVNIGFQYETLKHQKSEAWI